jgi:hypothetical protein
VGREARGAQAHRRNCANARLGKRPRTSSASTGAQMWASTVSLPVGAWSLPTAVCATYVIRWQILTRACCCLLAYALYVRFGEHKSSNLSYCL